MTRERLRFSKRVRWAYVALLSITVIGVIVPIITRVDASLRQGPVPLRHAFGTIGDDLGSWSRAVGHDGQLNWAKASTTRDGRDGARVEPIKAQK